MQRVSLQPSKPRWSRLSTIPSSLSCSLSLSQHSTQTSTSMDTSQWPPQEIVVKPFEEIVTISSSCASKAAPAVERKPRPLKEQALNCPRCNSTNTKFCYYNNYSLTQPRYFCKTCRRYWTEGGSLRNIPVGGGSRKNKRSSSSSSASKKLPDLVNPSSDKVVPENRELNLGFPTVSKVIQVPTDIERSAVNVDGSGQVSALELLSGITSSNSRGLTDSFFPMPIPDPAAIYESGFAFPDFKPSLSFSLDLIGNGVGFRSLHPAIHDSQGLKPVFTGDVDDDQPSKDPGDPTSGYWTTGMLGGDGSW